MPLTRSKAKLLSAEIDNVDAGTGEDTDTTLIIGEDNGNEDHNRSFHFVPQSPEYWEEVPGLLGFHDLTSQQRVDNLPDEGDVTYHTPRSSFDQAASNGPVMEQRLVQTKPLVLSAEQLKGALSACKSNMERLNIFGIKEISIKALFEDENTLLPREMQFMISPELLQFLTKPEVPSCHSSSLILSRSNSFRSASSCSSSRPIVTVMSDEKFKTTKFDGKNFKVWKTLMIHHFNYVNLFGVIRDEFTANLFAATVEDERPIFVSETYENYFQMNALACRTILSNVTPRISEELIDLPTAFHMWRKLESEYSIKLVTAQDDAFAQIHTLRFRMDGDMEKYIRIFNGLVQQYRSNGGEFTSAQELRAFSASLPTFFDGCKDWFESQPDARKSFGQFKLRVMDRHRAYKREKSAESSAGSSKGKKFFSSGNTNNNHNNNNFNNKNRSDNSGQKGPNFFKCYLCGGRGHTAAKCASNVKNGGPLKFNPNNGNNDNNSNSNRNNGSNFNSNSSNNNGNRNNFGNSSRNSNNNGNFNNNQRRNNSSNSNSGNFNPRGNNSGNANTSNQGFGCHAQQFANSSNSRGNYPQFGQFVGHGANPAPMFTPGASSTFVNSSGNSNPNASASAMFSHVLVAHAISDDVPNCPCMSATSSHIRFESGIPIRTAMLDGGASYHLTGDFEALSNVRPVTKEIKFRGFVSSLETVPQLMGDLEIVVFNKEAEPIVVTLRDVRYVEGMDLTLVSEFSLLSPGNKLIADEFYSEVIRKSDGKSLMLAVCENRAKWINFVLKSDLANFTIDQLRVSSLVPSTNLDTFVAAPS